MRPRLHEPSERPEGLILLLLAVLLLGGCGDPVPALRPLPDEAVILAFGDSLTHGTGAAPGQSYPAVLERLTGRRVVNAGLPGERSAEGIRRLPALLERHRPDLVVLCHGGNDLLRRGDADRLATNLRTMVEASRGHGAEVVLLGVPTPKLMFLESAPLYREVAEATGVPLEAEVIPRVESDEALKSDRIHPNEAGYRAIAEALAELLAKTGAL